MSNTLKKISAKKAYKLLSYWVDAIKSTGIIASHMPTSSSITIDLWSFSIKSFDASSQIAIAKTNAPAERMNTSATAKVQHYENDAYSIGFAVNDNLSISYTEENSEKVVKTTSATNVVTRPSVEMEITTIDVSYTMGGATLGISNSEHSNDSYTTGDDTTETIVAISLAF